MGTKCFTISCKLHVSFERKTQITAGDIEQIAPAFGNILTRCHSIPNTWRIERFGQEYSAYSPTMDTRAATSVCSNQGLEGFLKRDEEFFAALRTYYFVFSPQLHPSLKD